MTKRMEVFLLLTGLLGTALLVPSQVFAQGCSDDEAMVESYTKDLSALVETVQKESLEEFEKEFHQQTSLTKLSLSLGLVKELVSCLDKDAQNPAATKEQAASDKEKEVKFARLQSAIEKDERDLKAAGSSKTAKALIAKFDFTL